MNTIYFDYNATHPPFPGIIQDAYERYCSEFYNPSGATRYSLSRQSVIEEARAYFAKLTGKPKDDFVFCSTGTEANALLIGALSGYLAGFERVLVSPFEHSSLYGELEYFGIKYETIKTDKTGLVSLEDLESKLKKSPSPVFCIYAANETGVIQPVSAINSLLLKYDLPLFSDIMQAFCKIEVNYKNLSGFTFSAHKIGGGVGASAMFLDGKYFKKEYAIFKGGNQENSHRAGTENSPAITAFMNAAKMQMESLSSKNDRISGFRNKIETELKRLNAEIVAENSDRLPSTTFVILPLEDLDFFMMGMEEKGIVISTGSSCKSRTRDPSVSLLNMGYTKEEALRAVRISTGYFTSEEEVDSLLLNTGELLRVLS